MEWIAVSDQEPDPTAQPYIFIPQADGYPPIIAEYKDEPPPYARGIKGYWRDTGWGDNHNIALVFEYWLPCPPAPPSVTGKMHGKVVHRHRWQSTSEIKAKLAQGMTYEDAVPAEDRLLIAMEDLAAAAPKWQSVVEQECTQCHARQSDVERRRVPTGGDDVYVRCCAACHRNLLEAYTILWGKKVEHGPDAHR